MAVEENFPDFFLCARLAFSRLSSTIGESVRVSSSCIFDDIEVALKLHEIPRVFVSLRGEKVFMNTLFPMAKSLGALAQNFATDCETPIGIEVLKKKCQQIVAFPEAMSNAAKNADDNAAHFDATMYWERLCDTVWEFSLAVDNVSSVDSLIGEHSQYCYSTDCANVVTQIVVEVMARRGLLKLLMERFLFVDFQRCCDSCFPERMISVFIGAMNACCIRSFGRNVRRKSSDSFVQFVTAVLSTAVRQPRLRSSISNLFEKLLSLTDDTQDDDRNFSLVCLRDAVIDSIVKILTQNATSRNLVRFIFEGILGSSPISGERTEDENGSLDGFVRQIIHSVFCAWSDKNFVERESLALNATVMNATMYALILIRTVGSARLPPELLTPVLSGVSCRLESVRSTDLQKQATVVASAFASFFVENQEVAQGFLKEESFLSSFNQWLNEEGEISDPRPSCREQLDSKLMWSRRGAAVDQFPLDPNDDCFFFCFGGEDSPRSLQAVGNKNFVETTEMDFPSFGNRVIAEDSVAEHVTLLKTVRECYNALVGVGRQPNAQMHNIQHDIESGLLGMTRCLTELKETVTASSFVMVGSELQPLISVLIPTLTTLSIHAPEEKQKVMVKQRFFVLTHLVYFCPNAALFEISKMLYSSNYGIYQRVELAKAVGAAAKMLSAIAVVKSVTQAVSERPRKLIYPPIEHSNSESRLIMASEGKFTRRWGSAVEGRNTSHFETTSLLGEYAHTFVESLLAKMDKDHFLFFQSADPHAPMEILQALILVFQSLRSCRHVASEGCERYVPFFVDVISHHPHDSVRSKAWVAIGEVMRCWCGAAPFALYQDDGSFSISSCSADCSSLHFTNSWMTTLDCLYHISIAANKRHDPSGSVSALVVCGLNDLVAVVKDFTSMEKNCISKPSILST